MEDLLHSQKKMKQCSLYGQAFQGSRVPHREVTEALHLEGTAADRWVPGPALAVPSQGDCMPFLVLVGPGASKGGECSNPERACPGPQQRVQGQEPAPGPTVGPQREVSRRKGQSQDDEPGPKRRARLAKRGSLWLEGWRKDAPGRLATTLPLWAYRQPLPLLPFHLHSPQSGINCHSTFCLALIVSLSRFL